MTKSNTFKLWLVGLAVISLAFRVCPTLAQSPAAQLDTYNVVWNTPGKDARDSLPMGNGEVGANIWVEENGDFVFYVSRNDALSEAQRLMKLGRIRVHLEPNPFVTGQPFHEELHLHEGRLSIDAGSGDRAVHLNLLVDSGGPAIYLTGKSDRPETVQVTLEDWRETARQLNPTERESSWLLRDAPPDWATDATESADVFPADSHSLLWYHRNDHSVVARHIAAQGLTAYASLVHDPLKNNTFGGCISGAQFACTGPRTLRTTAPTSTFELRIATLAAQTPTPDVWLRQIRTLAHDVVPFAKAAARTAKWWSGYWDRSYIFVHGDTKSNLLQNNHSLRIGADANGQNLFAGQMGRVALWDRPLSPSEIATLSQSTPTTPSPISSSLLRASGSTPIPVGAASGDVAAGGFLAFNGGYFEAPTQLTAPRFSFSAEAWIRPQTVRGRILDKITPGGSDGFLVDLQNGKLRWIFGDRTLVGSTAIPADAWTHIAVVYDATRDIATLYQNGHVVGGDTPSVDPVPPSAVTRAYVYTKYQYACQMRSVFPAHFQGGIFTVDPRYAYYGPDIRKIDVTPDYRFYGANYWWQNTRFLYLPQLAQGNFDLMQPFFHFYLSNAPLFEARAKAYFGARGIYMQECISTFGLPGMGDFGYGAKEYSESYTRNIWQQCLELSVILLDYYEYTGDKAFLRDQALPWAKSALTFYETRFPSDAQGKLRITPTHAVETYWTDVVNDMPSVAGLQYVTKRLLALPETITTPADRAHWRQLRQELPALPKRIVDGKTIPDNAESYRPTRTNYEAPDLYCVFPFSLYGIGKTANPIEEAREAFRRMPNPDHTCWYQTGIFAARLGLTEDAQRDIQTRASAHLAGFRFAGFFGSPHDWCPDEDGPGNMSNTLQEMLLQCDGDQICLLPTWPRDWDVEFKLHAPHNTVVECRYRHGKIEELEITPASRKGDVILPLVDPGRTE